MQGSHSATLRFRRDQISSGVSRLGRLRAGGQLRIEYDAGRLADKTDKTATDIVCHVRFYPGGDERSGSLSLIPGALAGHGFFEATIPSETTYVEIWFEGREGSQATVWDSRYGQNYRFAVTSDGLPVPSQSVVQRAEAIVDAARIRVVEDTASKAQASAGATGSALHTGVTIRARIGTVSGAISAWADVHVFDASDDLIHSGTIALEKEAPPPVGEVLVWDTEVYQGSGGGSGAGVWFRPDAHTVQYRLYCELAGNVYTDGVLHQFEVPADTEVRPTTGGRW